MPASDSLPEGSGLLVAGNAGQRHFRGAQPACIDSAEHAAAVDHLRQHGGGNVEQRQQFSSQLQRWISKSSVREAFEVGDMLPAGGQLPGQPAVDSAEGQFAAFGATRASGRWSSSQA
jgi:hypothetical protein